VSVVLGKHALGKLWFKGWGGGGCNRSSGVARTKILFDDHVCISNSIALLF
jgi:hypothetical protein